MTQKQKIERLERKVDRLEQMLWCTEQKKRFPKLKSVWVDEQERVYVSFKLPWYDFTSRSSRVLDNEECFLAYMMDR